MRTNLLHINIRSWFERTNGNSYFSARAWAHNDDGTIIEVVIPFSYGHGTSSAGVAVLNELSRRGLSDMIDGDWDSNRIIYDWVPVARRKDLHMSGRGMAYVARHWHSSSVATESRQIASR